MWGFCLHSTRNAQPCIKSIIIIIVLLLRFWWEATCLWSVQCYIEFQYVLYTTAPPYSLDLTGHHQTRLLFKFHRCIVCHKKEQRIFIVRFIAFASINTAYWKLRLLVYKTYSIHVSTISLSQFVIKFRRKKTSCIKFIFLCQAVAVDVDDTDHDDVDTPVVLIQSKVVDILTRKAMYVNIIHN